MFLTHYLSPTKQKCAFGSCADSEAPDQTAQMCSLIRAFTANRIIRYYRIYEWRAKAPMIPCTSTGDLNLCILRTSEGTFSLVAPISESGDGHIKFSAYCQILDFFDVICIHVRWVTKILVTPTVLTHCSLETPNWQNSADPIRHSRTQHLIRVSTVFN